MNKGFPGSDYRLLLSGGYQQLCSWCGASFVSKRRDAKFCSSSCRSTVGRSGGVAAATTSAAAMSLHQCLNCNGPFWVKMANSRKMFCSDKCRKSWKRSETFTEPTSDTSRKCTECDTSLSTNIRRITCSVKCRKARSRRLATYGSTPDTTLEATI